MKRPSNIDIEDLRKMMEDVGIKEEPKSKRSRKIKKAKKVKVEEDLDLLTDLLKSAIIKDRNPEQEREHLVKFSKLLNDKVIHNKKLTESEKKQIYDTALIYAKFIKKTPTRDKEEEVIKTVINNKIQNIKTFFETGSYSEFDFLFESFIMYRQMYLWLKSVEFMADTGWGFWHKSEDYDRLIAQEP